MARPTPPSFVSGQSGWGALLNDLINLIFGAPLPVVTYPNTAALTAAHNPAQFEDCIAVAGGVLQISDGTSWNPV